MREIFKKTGDTLDTSRTPREQISFQVAPFPRGYDIGNLVVYLLAAAVATVLAAMGTRMIGLWVVELVALNVCILASEHLRSQALMIIVFVFAAMGVFFEVIPSEESVSTAMSSLIVVLGLIAGTLSFLRRQSILTAAAIAASGPVAIVCLVVLRQANPDPSLCYLVLFAIAIVGTIVLSDRIVSYLLATAQASIGQYALPTALIELQTASDRWSRPSAVRGIQLLGGLFVVGFVLLRTLPQRTSIDALGTAEAMLCLVLFCIAAAVPQLLLANELQRRSLESIIKSVLNAIGYFAFHDPHPNAPGVFRAAWPFGTMLPRMMMTLLVGSMLVASISFSASFFPITLRNSSAWLTLDEAVAKPYSYTGDDEAWPESNEHIREILSEQPLNWIQLAWTGFRHGKSFFALSLILAVVLSAVVPLAVFFSLLLLLVAPGVALIEDAWNEAIEGSEETCWDERVGLLQSANNQDERNSLLIGYHADAGYPVLLPRASLEEHAHILGDTGSGKTALGLMPLMTQLIRFGGRDLKDPDSFRSSVVVIDLKGDQSLFQSARQEAEKAGLPFRWFNIEYGRATHIFNPFLQGHVPKLGIRAWTETLAQALSLSYGVGYGRSHFGNANEQVLKTILTAFPEIKSFREFHERTSGNGLTLLGKKHGISKDQQDAASDLFAVADKLGAIQQMNVSPGDDVAAEVIEQRIDMQDVLHSPQVVYFYLPAGLTPTSSQHVARLALRSLLAAGVLRRSELESQGIHATADELQRVYLLIDEFQQVVSENLDTFFQQARSMKIATIVANQTLSDLETPSADLTPTVMANTRFKQYFASTDLAQQQALIDASGELIEYVESFGESSTGSSHSMSEQRSPRHARNDIIEVSNQPDASVVHIPRGSGYAQFQGYPFIMRSEFCVTREEYLQREAAHWPEADAQAGTMVFQPDSITHSNSKPPQGKRSSTTRRRKQTAQIEALYDMIEKEQKRRAGRKP